MIQGFKVFDADAHGSINPSMWADLPEQYRTRAHGLYERGVEQLFFWDTNQRTYLYPSWAEISRLGHREDLARWVASGSPRVERPGKKLTKLGDWVMGYVTPG